MASRIGLAARPIAILLKTRWKKHTRKWRFTLDWSAIHKFNTT